MSLFNTSCALKDPQPPHLYTFCTTFCMNYAFLHIWPRGQHGPSPICNRNPNRHLCTPSMPFPVLSTPFYASCALMWPRGRLRPSPICNINPQPPPLYTYAISCAIYAFLRLVCPHVASWTTQTLANLQQKPNALGSNCVHPASYLSSGLSLKHVPSIRVASIDRYYILPCNFTPRYTKTASR